MKQVATIIKQLQNTSGTNDKIAIVKANADNEILKKVLYYTYNPLMTYKITESVFEEYTAGNSALRVRDVFSLLDILANSNINDQLREQVVAFVESQDEDIQWLIKGMLFKDLRINMGVKNINKAIPKLIPAWEVQQGHPVDKVKKFKPNEWYCLALKLNGIRSTFYDGGFRSRQNQPMTGYQHIIDDLTAMCNHFGQDVLNWVFDGELIHKNRDYAISDNENFRLTCSIVNSDAPEKPQIELVLFDMLPIAEFNQGESKLGYKMRLERLKRIQSAIDSLGLEHIRIAPVFYEGNGVDQTVIDHYLDWTSEMKLEGLMLIRDFKYQCKRHAGILKVKRFFFSDVRIIGYEEGEGKHEGKLGSFIIDFKGTPVGVGSGYTDAEREEYWANRDFYVGKILEVKYKEETKNKKDDKISLQFPTFSRMRLDKDEVSYES